MNKQKFTLIELMFTITILVILIGIGASATNKVMRKQADIQIKAELKMIQSALAIYKTRYSSYPPMTDPKVITCADYLRQVKVQENNGQYLDAYEDPYKYLIDPITGKLSVFSINQN